MKVLNAAALAFILALASGYALRGFDGLNEETYEVTAGPPPAPTLKPKAWTVYEAGRLRRLSLRSFGKPYQERVKAPLEPAPARSVAAPTPVQGFPVIDLSSDIGQSAALIRLDTPHDYEAVDFVDTLAELAQESPIQPQKHPCAASSKSIKSVGMERHINQSASLGVEYVYKEKCHSKSMSALSANKLPDETGVKLRLNMRF